MRKNRTEVVETDVVIFPMDNEDEDIQGKKTSQTKVNSKVGKIKRKSSESLLEIIRRFRKINS